MELEKKGKLLGLHRENPRYAKSQHEVDRIISGRLGGIRFSSAPQYNGRIINGRTVIDSLTGRIKRIEIGRQESPSDYFLTDTLLHEELEARIAKRAFRGIERFKKIFDKAEPRHQYIEAVISRYFRLRGWR